jgi:hypothetical protein
MEGRKKREKGSRRRGFGITESQKIKIEESGGRGEGDMGRWSADTQKQNERVEQKARGTTYARSIERRRQNNFSPLPREKLNRKLFSMVRNCLYW